MLKIFYEVENYIVLRFLMYSNGNSFFFKDIISKYAKILLFSHGNKREKIVQLIKILVITT